jgi:hypothetical protein
LFAVGPQIANPRPFPGSSREKWQSVKFNEEKSSGIFTSPEMEIVPSHESSPPSPKLEFRTALGFLMPEKARALPAQALTVLRKQQLSTSIERPPA